MISSRKPGRSCSLEAINRPRCVSHQQVAFAGAVEPQPRARKVGSEGPLPDWETPNEISGQNVPVTYSTKCERKSFPHDRRLCAVTEVKNVLDQSGPAGASPTHFRPADRIERLTSEPSNARIAVAEDARKNDFGSNNSYCRE